MTGSGSAMTGSQPSIRARTGTSGRLWRRSLASPQGLRQHVKGTRLPAVPPKGALGARVHDDPATIPAPRTTDLDDAHVGPDPQAPTRRAPAAGQSANAWVCPFLRSRGADDGVGLPLELPDPLNACAAFCAPVPQSLRQQELVCLTSGHVNCPRYLRGSLVDVTRLDRVEEPAVVTRAIAGSVAAVVVAFLLSVGFVVANGGLSLTAAIDSPSGSRSGNVVADTRTPAPTSRPTPAATAIATPSATATAPTPTPIPSATAAPTATPGATAAPTAVPTSRPRPAPTAARTSGYPAGATASRMRLVMPCPDTVKCYVYRIRSGDNLYSIANYFGVSLATTTAWNPWTSDGLKAGRALRIPPPTR